MDAPPPKAPKEYRACPEDSGSLGRAGWSLLHTMAAYYPAQPTQQNMSDMSTFLDSFSRLYPCDYCASHLQ